MAPKLISFDWAIKKLLRSKANFGILEGFLSELLFTDIKIVAILESESDRENSKNKQNQVDIKVEDSNGQLILIEVQFSREQDYLFRILFSSAKCLVEHMDKGAPYSDVSKVISISILDFAFFTGVGAGDDYIYRGTTEFFGLHNNHKLELNTEQKGLFSCEKVADMFPEHYIINVRNFNDIAKEPLDEWIYFLKNEEVKEDFHAKGLLEAKEKLDVLKLSPSEKADYDRHIYDLRREASLYQSSYVLGEMKGEAKGEAKSDQKHYQKTIESVRKMLLKGLSIVDVAEFSGLLEDEIKQVQRQLDSSEED
jgi:predicted transposase/invertase (TIGR01784 family)